MREEELKREAQKRRTISEQSWAFLVDEGDVEIALERPFDEGMVEYTIDRFDKFRAAFPVARNRAKPEGRTKEVPIAASLRPEEADRAAAFEEYLSYAGEAAPRKREAGRAVSLARGSSHHVRPYRGDPSPSASAGVVRTEGPWRGQ
jgi:hypothetical protein